MTELSYSCRPSVFARERMYELGPDALSWKDPHGAGSIAYADVVRMRLYSAVNAFGPTVRRCILHSRAGHKVVLQSMHYVRFGKTEDRVASYAPFVKELAGRVAAANANAEFLAGLAPSLFVTYWALLIIGSIFVVLTALLVFTGNATGTNTVPIILLAFILPAAWRTLRQGRARRVGPGEISEELISK